LFHAPTTHPNQVLDGVLLEGKQVPPFLENLENPNLENPGFKALFTFKLGNKLEVPTKIVLTRLGLIERNAWDTQVDTAGNSAMAIYWEPKEIPAHGKREIAYGYGQGIPCINEGHVAAEFGGSFEPGKKFTITAYVEGPVDGQNLTLQLPQG